MFVGSMRQGWDGSYLDWAGMIVTSRLGLITPHRSGVGSRFSNKLEDVDVAVVTRVDAASYSIEIGRPNLRNHAYNESSGNVERAPLTVCKDQRGRSAKQFVTQRRVLMVPCSALTILACGGPEALTAKEPWPVS